MSLKVHIMGLNSLDQLNQVWKAIIQRDNKFFVRLERFTDPLMWYVTQGVMLGTELELLRLELEAGRLELWTRCRHGYSNIIKIQDVLPSPGHESPSASGTSSSLSPTSPITGVSDKPLALMLADKLDLEWERRMAERTMLDAAAELRRLHARVAELEVAPALVAPILSAEQIAHEAKERYRLGPSRQAFADGALWAALAAPAPVARQPLSHDAVKAILTKAGYDTFNVQARTDFIAGLRHGEAAQSVGHPDDNRLLMQAFRAMHSERALLSRTPLAFYDPTTQALRMNPAYVVQVAKSAWRGEVPLYVATTPVARPLTHMQAVLLWGHRGDGPSTAEIVSFASAVERTCAEAWGIKLAKEGGAA